MDTIPKQKAESLVEITQTHAQERPDKAAFIYLEDGEREAGTFTYKALDTRARAIGADLISKNLSGERALLIYESGLDYIDSFFGCLYAGVISVPLHPPGKNKSLSRISAIAKDSGAKVILSTHEIRTELENEFSKDEVLKDLKWTDTETITNDHAGQWSNPGITGDTLAYLQYTSGSTGIPKGVMVNHRNLIHNIGIIDSSHPHDDNSVMVTWLPIHHDMGLIYGMLLPFCNGYPCYFMTPQAFVQKPYRWLHAISKYKGTHNAAPNFAFELCVNKVTEEQKKTLDLSSWTTAMNAAEPVRYETIQKFADYFKDCGFKLVHFSPGYGLAEGTLILSTTFTKDVPAMKRFDDASIEKNNFAKDADEKDSTSKVHVGHSNSIQDTRIAIVDPVTLLECKDGQVGEVWASGISIAQGYWQREDATKETFKAHIADTNEGPFLRTGDLGFIKDNELYITGRHKDLIIIRGQNHYPQDIEYTVEASHPALRLGCVAAFATDEDGEEHLGIVQEVQKNFVNDFDTEEVVRAIRKAVSEEHDLQVSSITLIQPGTVPKTSSGKIQRRACLAGVANGSLEVIAQWKAGEISDKRVKKEESKKPEAEKKLQPVSNLKEWIIVRLSELMQIKKESIDVNEPFAAYGMDSLKAVQLSGDLETLLNKELPATLVYDYPTINLLSAYLNEGETVSTVSTEATVSTVADAHEPIAVVGIGLRFPGANNVSEFWNNLKNGVDSIREIPEGRWDKSKLNKNTVEFGGFVDDVDKFDPMFFGISPREAIQMDPQQRFTLETAWQALEDAGINPESLAGTNAGVFIGICTYDYSRYSTGRKELFDVYTGTGTSLSIAANRLSYVYDFRGPSIAIDTACSSSLVALHTACESLRSGQSSIALAGGVNLLLAPDWNVVFTEADMLAPDGHCKTFDASADGYVRSEGCGIIVLKKLSDAIKDSDRIYSVIKGSAINQDGKSNGLTAPNGPSQEEVIKSALANAQVKPSQISYFETHGTGTPLGDPIEVNSLTKVITKERSPENICYIGSVKTNIGHLEAAAGIAGVIKTSLALYNKEIPKHLNYSKLNPEILLEDKPVKVADKNIEWNGTGRHAGISSFGFGGTNAHIILAEAPVNAAKIPTKTKPFNLFTISAKSEAKLNELAKSYIKFIDDNPEVKIEDICHVANTGRASHNHRAAIVCNSADDLKKSLNELINEKFSLKTITGAARINHFPKTAFLFPGQGAQFIGMGKELYDTHPLFRNTINKCDEILRNYLDKPLLEVLFYEKDEALNPINETTYTQPALFSIEYALAQLWMSWGIKPSVMMGHSAGEYVAACLAGVFSLEDGLKLVTERGRLMQTMTEDGEMYTVFTNEEGVKKFLNGYDKDVSVASINGPLKTVISGKKEALGQIIPLLDENNIEYKKINVSIASHSPLMNSMIEEFRKVCNTVSYSTPNIPVVSNITGEIVTDKISNADYWCDHILSTVRFSEGIKACVNSGVEFFIDLGPKPTSISMGQETIQNNSIHWLPSIKYNFSIWETMLLGLGTLYVNGTEINWKNLDKDFAHKKISLPSYPFQKTRYWIGDIIENEKKESSVFNEAVSADTLFGSRLLTASDKELIFNSSISGNDPYYLRDHVVFNEIVLPGAAYVEMAISALKDHTGNINISASDIKFHRATILKENEFKDLQTIISKTSKGKYSFEIFSADQNENKTVNWTLHCSGNLNIEKASALKSSDINKLKSDFKNETAPAEFYDNVKVIGIDYRKDFQAIRKLFFEKDKAFAEVRIDGSLQERNYTFNPALLDACFQSAIALVLNNSSTKDKAFIPVGIDSITVHAEADESAISIVELNSQSKKDKKIHSSDISIYTTSGELIAKVNNLRLKEVSKDEFLSANSDSIKDWFYEIAWEESPLSGSVNIDNILKATDSKLKDLTKKNHLSSYSKGIESIENLALKYILNALIDAGFKFDKGKSFTAQEFLNEIKAVDKHKKLCIRLLDILTNGKTTKKKDDRYEFRDNIERSDVTNDIEEIKKKYPETEKELNLLVRCGEKLGDVITGKMDGLQLLFPDGDFTSVSELYRNSSAFVVMNQSIRNAVKAVADSYSGQRSLNILEIGAGTGSTAAYILPELKDKNYKYTFTDISPAFFGKAKEEFKKYENVEYKILDVEKDPLQQNFAKNEYDVIIASNVVHATKDLKQTMKNVVELLSESGVVILNEVTSPRTWIDLTFGLTDGWWRFEDNELRKDHPLLDEKRWKNFIKEIDFNAEISSPDGLSDQSTIIIQQNKKGKETKYFIFSDHKTAKNIPANIRKKSTVLTELNDFDKIKNEADLRIDHIIDANSDPIDGNVRTLELIRAIKNTLTNSPVLNIITTNAKHVIDKDKVDGLEQSPAWGFKKVIDLELPELRCRIFDIDDIKNIEDALTDNDNTETEVAYRSGKRYVQRLRRKNILPKEFSVNEKGTYLITGGLSGIGLLTAQWLSNKGAKNLVLTGRRGMISEAENIINEIKTNGTNVIVHKADVTKKEELENVIKEIDKGKNALKGIIHSVGVLDDGVILNQTKEKFERVMSPKVTGAMNLHELTKKHKLDFFVMYSSVASVLGSAGQANHSSANAFLDSLAYYRRSRKLPAQSINWGVWTEIGSAAEKGADTTEKIKGIKNINPTEGIRALERVLSSGSTEIAVIPMDWKKFGDKNKPGFVKDLIPASTEAESGTIETKKEAKKDFISELLGSPEDEHTDLLIKYFQNLISGIMGMEPDELEADIPLNMMGLDSLMAIELKNKVNIELGVDLNLVRYMEETNITNLADELKEQLPKIINKKNTASTNTNGSTELSEEDKARDLLGNLDNLTDEELDRLLNETK